LFKINNKQRTLKDQSNRDKTVVIIARVTAGICEGAMLQYIAAIPALVLK
jgi:hypothetical protein